MSADRGDQGGKAAREAFRRPILARGVDARGGTLECPSGQYGRKRDFHFEQDPVPGRAGGLELERDPLNEGGRPLPSLRAPKAEIHARPDRGFESGQTLR
jgi:hypothetical protein